MLTFYEEIKLAMVRYYRAQEWTVPPGVRVDIDSYGPAAGKMAVRIKAHEGVEKPNVIPGERLWAILRGYGLPAGILDLYKKQQAADEKEAAAARKHDAAAVVWTAKQIGPLENLGRNDGSKLRVWDEAIGDEWMYLGEQPYCVQAGTGIAYHYGAKIDLKAAFPGLHYWYCPTVADAIRDGLKSKDGSLQFIPVDRRRLEFGDIIIFRWAGAPLPGHMGRARETGDYSNGGPTWEFNTPPSTLGDQSGLGSGDGCWPKWRDASVIHTTGRLVATA